MAHSHIQRMQMMRMGAQMPPPQAPDYRASSIISGSNPPSVIGGGGGSAPSYTNYNSAPRPTSVASVGMRGGPGGGGNHHHHQQPREPSIASMGRPVSSSSMGPSGFKGGPGSVSTVPGGYRPGPGSVSSMGFRSASRTSLGGGLAGTSRSLRASKASLASVKSMKSTIQQEAHDRKVQDKLRAPWYGPGRTPFMLAMIFFGVAVLVFVIGLTLLILRLWGNLFLTLDKGELVGPLLMASSFLFIGLGIKFIYDAYTVGSLQRNKTTFRAASASMVSINSINSKPRYKGEQAETLLSGTASKNAITRTPLGSRVSLSDMM